MAKTTKAKQRKTATSKIDRRVRARFGAVRPKGDFCRYSEARIIVKTLGIRTGAEYRRWCAEHPRRVRQLRLPRAPHVCYRAWSGWHAFLGTSGRGRTGRTYLEFDAARKIAREWAKQHRLTSEGDWMRWAGKHRALLAQHKIPVSPSTVLQYKKVQKTKRRIFISYADWLGTNTAASKPHFHE